MKYNEIDKDLQTLTVPDTMPLASNDESDWDRLVGAGGDPQSNSNQGKKNSKAEKSAKETPMLEQYGISLNDQARNGDLDPVYGRDKELQRIAQILCRRKKNNPILLGDPGVGKTAVVEALAQRIEERKVPLPLIGKNIVSLDLASLIAGSMYRGQFEERLKGLISEIKDHPEIILYIDEIHTIMGSGNVQGGLDAANILKPALARGEIRCIGATTLDEFRKTIEKDGAMDRRFQKVIITATDEEETLLILKNLQSSYEKHHHVRYSEDALRACVSLTARYVTDRNFPDKAIDALDEVGSYVFMKNQTEPKKLKSLEEKVKSLHNEKMKAVDALDYEAATDFRDRERDAQKELDDYLDALSDGELTDEERYEVTIEDVERVVALTTGVPVESVTVDDLKSLSGIEQRLSSRVIGQDHVIREVAGAIQRHKIGLRDPSRPIGTFLFLGSTGVGKTLLSKQLAKELFGSEEALIRIDMSEFMERHTVSRLIGAPPGYVGYDEGGELTEKVLRRPYSVVLFDEIEKANPQVHNLLLQLLDDGVLTDSNGKKVSFKNTIIIMTSNVGTRQLSEFGTGIGFKDASLMDLSKVSGDVIQKALKSSFSPEFLNRIDRIVTFNALGREDIRRIVDLELSALQDRIQGLGIRLDFSESLMDLLASKGFDPQYGARPLKRTIVKYVEDVITQAILDGELNKDCPYLLDVEKSESGDVKSVIKAVEPSLCS